MDARIDSIAAAAYRVPTEEPESDGTLEWDSTTMVVVHAHAGGRRGLGYTYASAAAATLVHEKLADVVRGRPAMDVPAAWHAMVHQLRNIGVPGIGSMAVSAVDAALWDLKARLLDLPLATLLGQVREAVPVYGSGGFTSYSVDRLQRQLASWIEQGIPRVKIKVGREPDQDPRRVHAAREAIGPGADLFVDANGAYTAQQALAMAHRFTDDRVTWFEEPRPSDDTAGLRFIRERAPAGMEITGGEYASDLAACKRLLDAGAVDVLQPDLTRCGGVTGFLRAATLCEAAHTDLSSHTAQALSLHACCAAPRLRHMECFHDHARIEAMLLDGVAEPRGGLLRPDLTRPGHGLTFKEKDAQRLRI